ncbi:cardiotrophin-2-like [Polypterus senegalus]|uniref:cardiotrophin-2-like n=1 Tax=Polypterus senegalus TaxID=55291 RepID=UPI00196266E6|nr:cardiotrophin-2-like [Polypterus senegalus]
MSYIIGTFFILTVELFGDVRTAPVPTVKISQTYSLSLMLQTSSANLLNTYLQYQGSPFSDPGFSAPDLQLAVLPTVAIGFLAWRSMAVEERLSSNIRAYSVYIEFLQLVMDDQSQLNPAAKDLKDALEHHHTHLQGLKSNISEIMTNMGFQVPVVADTISSTSFNVSEFQRKIRGYVFCKELKLWIDRTVRDFQLLKTTFPTA